MLLSVDKVRYMTQSTDETDYIVEELLELGGVMRADIHANGESVTTYVPADLLETAKQLENIDIEVLEDHEHECLISATVSK